MTDKEKMHTPTPWVVTTCNDYWIEPANKPTDLELEDHGFCGIAECGSMDWPNYEKRQEQWEANARLIVTAVNQYCDPAYTVVRTEDLERARNALSDALENADACVLYFSEIEDEQTSAEEWDRRADRYRDALSSLQQKEGK